MTPKEYLNQYKKNVMELRRLEESIAQLQERAVSITASSDGDRVQSSGNKDKIGAIVSQVADMQSERYNKMSECLNKMDEIEKTIDAVEDPRYRRLIHLRYINMKEWEDIMQDMKYERTHVYRLHGQALLKVKEIIENRGLNGTK